MNELCYYIWYYWVINWTLLHQVSSRIVIVINEWIVLLYLILLNSNCSRRSNGNCSAINQTRLAIRAAIAAAHSAQSHIHNFLLGHALKKKEKKKQKKERHQSRNTILLYACDSHKDKNKDLSIYWLIGWFNQHFWNVFAPVF